MMLKSPKKNTCHFFLVGNGPSTATCCEKCHVEVSQALIGHFTDYHARACLSSHGMLFLFPRLDEANASQKCLRKARMSIQFKAKCFIKSQDVWI